MSTLREIKIDKPSLRDLEIGDALVLPRRSYLVTGMASGGMGTVIFGKLDRSKENGSISALPNPIALKFSHDPACFVESELSKWALLSHERINPLCEILASENDGLVAASLQCSGSVRDLLSRHGRLSERCAYSIVRSCAEGLAFAEEEHDIHHLDVKPDNLLFQEAGKSPEEFRYSVTDWGISSEKTRGSEATECDSEGNPLSANNAGTLPYMAPERFIPGTPSSRESDIYGLGMTWLELLTGTLPFIPGRSLGRQIADSSYFAVADAHMKQFRLSRRMANAIRKSIHPEKNLRTGSWKEFLDEIRPGLIKRLFT